LNVTAIVLEIPSDWFGADHIGVWATKPKPGRAIRSHGRPAINTRAHSSNLKDAFNNTDPKHDQKRFRSTCVELAHGA